MLIFCFGISVWFDCCYSSLVFMFVIVMDDCEFN